jgi:amidase
LLVEALAMTDFDKVTWLDATAQADLVRRKQLSAVELVEAAIARIERLNPALNAVITTMYEEARAAAAGTLPEGPFTGVPFLLKDIIACCRGVCMTCGSPSLSRYVPDHDSELVARYRRAGLIILGKTNLPEFGILPTTESRLHGRAHNPWDLTRTTGGSSGGSAAAVAAGLVAMAHGNDGGGSIRIPASCCGVFGLKPTRARNPLGPDFGDMGSGLVAEHALTRSVRDSAALLDATAGPDIGDPYWAPPADRSFIDEVGADPGRLHIGFTAEPATDVEIHPDCVDAVLDAAKLCADLGHEVTEAKVNLPGQLMMHSFTAVWSALAAWSVDSTAYATGQAPGHEQFEPLTWAVAERARQQSASAYLMAVSALQRVSRQVARLFVDYDVLLTPTLAQPPLLLGSFDAPPDNPWQALVRAGEFVPFTPLCNITGQPAMSVPLYWNNDGLPIGSHFIGRFGEEATLFRLAAQLEAARPWAHRRPSVSA